MSYTYFLDIYAFIHQRLEEIQRALVAAREDDGQTRQSAAGRIEALCDLERFLREHYEAKLPRRIMLQRPRVQECQGSRAIPKN